MPKTIKSSELNPNATYLVRGKVGYSRVTRQTTDQERAEENKRRMHPVDKNYTNITIYNATVLAKDPSNPTIEEKYASESLYQSSSPKYPGNNFSAMNKTRNLPIVGVLTPTPESPNNYVEIRPEGELASGLDVTLVMRVYKGQGSNNGVSLDRILVNEPIKYYGGNTEVDKTLSNFGITFQAMAPEKKAELNAQASAPAEAAPVATAPVENTAPANNFAPVNAQPAPAPTPEAAPAAAGNPFSSYEAAPQNIQFGPGTRQY